MNYYNIRISPETIKSDFVTVNYNGENVGVYSAMTEILSGGTNGSSILTGLTIPIMLTETTTDLGYYSPFDGAILQKDVVTNFIFSATTGSPYTYYVYNTCDEFQKFLELSEFTIDWGDGSATQQFNGFTPNYISHLYPVVNKKYTITMRQKNPWGVNIIQKNIETPYKISQSNNPKGTAHFVSNTGSWSATPISYDFIFSGDAINIVSEQVSSNYTTTPFYVSGQTYSQINDLESYGPSQYVLGVPIIRGGEIFGVITNIAPTFTAYTIQNIDYYDYNDGTTVFFAPSNGFDSNNITAEPIVKEEVLIKVIDQPQIQTDVYVERGKNSAYERIQRLGEVDNLGSLVDYGYGFFNVEKKT
jgi:hypothetical protein